MAHPVCAIATGNARHPRVESLTAGTNRLSVVEDRSLVFKCQKTTTVTVQLCRHYKSCGESHAKKRLEESLEATLENRHNGCGRDILGQTVPLLYLTVMVKLEGAVCLPW